MIQSKTNTQVHMGSLHRTFAMPFHFELTLVDMSVLTSFDHKNGNLIRTLLSDRQEIANIICLLLCRSF